MPTIEQILDELCAESEETARENQLAVDWME